MEQHFFELNLGIHEGVQHTPVRVQKTMWSKAPRHELADSTSPERVKGQGEHLKLQGNKYGIKQMWM